MLTHEVAVHVLNAVMSIITLTSMWMAGNKHRWTWAVGLGNQVLWSVFIIYDEKWMLIPMNLGAWGIYLWNHYKWMRDPSLKK